jgi:hypothetical protein
MKRYLIALLLAAATATLAVRGQWMILLAGSPPAAGGGTLIKYDTFTDTNLTALNAHTSDTGLTWGTDASNFIISLGTAINMGAVRHIATGTETITSANYYVEASVKTVGTGATDQPAVVARMVDTSNYYFAQLYAPTGSIYCEKKVAGSFAVIGTPYAIPGFSASTSYVIRFHVSGTSPNIVLTVDLDGTPRITDVPAQSDLSLAGLAGIMNISSNSSFDLVTIHTE